FPVDAARLARRAVAVGELAAHGQPQASLEALEGLECGGRIGGALDPSPRPLAFRGLRRERLRDLLDQAREPRLIALEPADFAPPASDIAREPREQRRARGALLLEAAGLLMLRALVLRKLVAARPGVVFEHGELARARAPRPHPPGAPARGCGG